MSQAIKHVVPDWVKPSSAFLTSGHSDPERQSAWMLNITNNRMLYSCTYMATVGAKVLVAGQ